MPGSQEEKSVPEKLTRRGFLKAAGVAAAALSTAEALASCQPTTQLQDQALLPATEIPIYNQYPEVPYPPDSLPPAKLLLFFSPQEAKTLDDLVSRILPGSPDDPGAHEAGVVNYIDKYLGMRQGFSEPTYREAPFAQTYEGDQPPQDDPGNNYQVIWVKKEEFDRYGFQSIQTPQEMYRLGLASVNSYAKKKYDLNFSDLTEDQQDQILTDMEAGAAEGFDHPSAQDFFDTLRTDTINGMFSDPAYGGNADMVGWKLIQYPGAQRAYTPVDIHTEAPVREPQSLMMMHAFHPGEAVNPDVIVPVSGRDEQQPQ